MSLTRSPLAPAPAVRRAAALVAALALVATATACSGLPRTGNGKGVTTEASVVQIAVEDREAPIELSGETLEGEAYDLAETRGDVVVVNIWGSWCGPCRREMPLLARSAAELDATFLGINIRDNSPEAAQALQRSAGVPYPSLYDPGSETLLAFGSKYGPRMTPSTLVLDRQGRTAAIISGEIPSELTLSGLVEEVAAEDG